MGSSFKINQRELDKAMREIAKGLERAARKHPVSVPMRVESIASPRMSGEPLEQDPVMSRLVTWLAQRTASHPGRYQNLSHFTDEEGDLPPGEADILGLRLEEQGLAKVLRTFGSGSRTVILTDAGELAARRLARLRSDRAARFAHACDALLRWMYDTGPGGEAVAVTAFADSRDCRFAGDPLTTDEVTGALERLVRHGFARLTDDPAAVAAQITQRGIDRVLSGGSVNTPAPQAGNTWNVHNSPNSVVGNQSDFTQNNHHGFDASAVRDWAELVRQIAPTLQGTPQEEADIVRDAEILIELVDQENPEPGRVRALFDGIQNRLTGLGGASAALTLLLAQAEQARQAVFG
ncbi:hypothetical protein ACFZBU_38795 [Embleya sp. NPDC008237]|uniref:hypothetical protein n=1 Tax=Embleya sp. NPDC008237 TaxID=3363978 RepID=UPI0036E07D5F